MEFWPIFFPAVAVEAFSVVVTASMVGVVQRLLVAAFGLTAPQVFMFIDGGQVSFVCPSGLALAPGASPPRCSPSTSSALFRHFRSWSRRQRWSPTLDETGCGTSPARPQQWVPDVGNMDTPLHPQLGVAVENLEWIAGALASCWTKKSSELSSHHIPHPRRVRINPPS